MHDAADLRTPRIPRIPRTFRTPRSSQDDALDFTPPRDEDLRTAPCDPPDEALDLMLAKLEGRHVAVPSENAAHTAQSVGLNAARYDAGPRSVPKARGRSGLTGEIIIERTSPAPVFVERDPDRDRAADTDAYLLERTEKRRRSRAGTWGLGALGALAGGVAVLLSFLMNRSSLSNEHVVPSVSSASVATASAAERPPPPAVPPAALPSAAQSATAVQSPPPPPSSATQAPRPKPRDSHETTDHSFY
jgi:hypothetical protein